MDNTEEKEDKAMAALGQRLSTETPNGNPLPGAIIDHHKRFGKEDAARQKEARAAVTEDEAGTKAPVYSDHADADLEPTATANVVTTKAEPAKSE